MKKLSNTEVGLIKKKRVYGLQLKIEATHLKCISVNNCLNIYERTEMLDRNKDVFLHSTAAL